MISNDRYGVDLGHVKVMLIGSNIVRWRAMEFDGQDVRERHNRMVSKRI